jgi:hypothetical protein
MKKISKHFNPFGFSLLLLSMFLFAGALPVSARTHSGGGSSPSSCVTIAVGNYPVTLAIDSSGNVWVVNSDNVTELNSSGKTVGTYAAGATPGAIAIDLSGNVWVTNDLSNSVTELNSSGKTVGTYAVGPNPGAIAIDSSGNVWVANNGGDSVTELIKAAKGPEYFPYSGPRWP